VSLVVAHVRKLEHRLLRQFPLDGPNACANHSCSRGRNTIRTRCPCGIAIRSGFVGCSYASSYRRSWRERWWASGSDWWTLDHERATDSDQRRVPRDPEPTSFRRAIVRPAVDGEIIPADAAKLVAVGSVGDSAAGKYGERQSVGQFEGQEQNFRRVGRKPIDRDSDARPRLTLP
jgi:hypothetical protein